MQGELTSGLWQGTSVRRTIDTGESFGPGSFKTSGAQKSCILNSFFFRVPAGRPLERIGVQVLK